MPPPPIAARASYPARVASPRSPLARQGDPMLDRRSFLLGGAATLALAPAWRARAQTAPASSHTLTAGLTAPVEIIDDVYGVPHIRAQTIPDAFFGQGYVVA